MVIKNRRPGFLREVRKKVALGEPNESLHELPSVPLEVPDKWLLGRYLQGDEFEAMSGRFALQGGEFALRMAVFELPSASIDPRLAMCEHSVDQAGKVTGHGFDGLGCSPPCS